MNEKKYFSVNLLFLILFFQLDFHKVQVQLVTPQVAG
jgi:hypothetical protein